MKYHNRRSLEIEFVHNLACPEFPLRDTPFISAMDADEEYLTIFNPSSEELCLDHYFVVDSKRLHKFTFGKDHIVPAHSQLHLYTCPGGNYLKGHFISPYALWMNHDGSLRRKEVLNNGISIISSRTPL
jgi:hypothetical protein